MGRKNKPKKATMPRITGKRTPLKVNFIMVAASSFQLMRTDCTLIYINYYYTAHARISSPAIFQKRMGH